MTSSAHAFQEWAWESPATKFSRLLKNLSVCKEVKAMREVVYQSSGINLENADQLIEALLAGAEVLTEDEQVELVRMIGRHLDKSAYFRKAFKDRANLHIRSSK